MSFIETTLLLQILAGAAVVVLCMYVVIRMVNFAAWCLLLLLFFGACMFSTFKIIAGDWDGWFEVLSQCALTGAVTALLSLPVLPFTNLYNKNK